jgi:AcrR family transcriptional regulator
MAEGEGPDRRSYHHGNLRQALVEATLELVVSRGPHGFTIAEAAKLAGVSAAAPYRHFRNKEEMIGEAARQGFEIFADLMERAYARGEPSTLAAFEAVGRAYLAFARKFPGYYITMFESGIAVGANRDLAASAGRAMAVLTEAATRLSAHLPAERRPPPTMVAHHIWALSHGVVELFARGEAGSRAPFSAEDLLESGTGIYLRGLGLIGPDAGPGTGRKTH